MAVGEPGDRLEQEADAAAERVAAGQPVQRLSRGAASGECPACAAERAKGGAQRKCAGCAQRDSKDSSEPAAADTASAERSMRDAGPGAPLDPDLRGTMEGRFGEDFGDVRIHRDAAADRANRALDARAFTRGSDVYLRADSSADDRKLMAHELSHVVQQSPGDAETVQRQPAEGDAPEIAAQLAEEVDTAEQSARLADTPESRNYFVRLGLLLEGIHQPLKTDADLDAFLNAAKSAAEVEWETLGALDDHAWVARGSNRSDTGNKEASEAALKSHPEAFPNTWSGRIRRALDLGADKDALSAEQQKALDALRSLAKGLPDAIIAEGLPVTLADKDRLPLFRLSRDDAQSSGAVADFARAAVRYSQVRSVLVFALAWQDNLNIVVKAIEDGDFVVNYDDWQRFVEHQQPTLRVLPQRAETDLGTTDDKAEKFDTDMDDIVNAGALVAGVSLLAGLKYGATDGWEFARQMFGEQLATANDVVAGGSGDGRVTRLPMYVALHTATSLIPGAGIFGDSDGLARFALALTWAWEHGYFGDAASQALSDLVDHIVSFVLETIAFLAAQEVPFLNILVDIFAGAQMLEQIGQFVDIYEAAIGARRVGPLQHAGARLAEFLGSTAVQVAAGAVVSAGFHAVDPIGRVRSRLGEGDAEPGAKVGSDPLKPPTAPHETAPASVKGVLEEEALVKKPVEGHEVVVTEEGVGICSPDPCPVIGVEYAQELADHPELKEWNDQVQELRKTNPARAADEAARLVRTAEAARANAARAARAAGEEPIFTLGVGKDRMERIRTGERDFVVDRRLTFDIDEVLPVGERGIKPQRAVDRAMSAENRQLLDPNTNQRTKGLGIDRRELPSNRTPRQPVSVTTNPHALLTHRFSEIPELQRIFDRAVESVKNKGELTPTELKARINAETRRIITEDMGADAVAVRQALTDLGFVRQPNVGWVMTTGGMPQRPPPTGQ
jgi:hypothetical protein